MVFEAIGSIGYGRLEKGGGPILEMFVGAASTTWLDHRRQVVGIEDEEGVITWRNCAGEVVDVTNEASDDMHELARRSTRAACTCPVHADRNPQ